MAVRKRKLPKIFVVDDDNIYRGMIVDYLREEGYRDVEDYGSGDACIAHLKNDPDLIFLDYDMLGMNGLETLKAVKKYDKDISVILLSGQENIQTALDALKHGAFEYIVKSDATFQRISFNIKKVRVTNDMVRENERFKKQKVQMLVGLAAFAVTVGTLVYMYSI